MLKETWESKISFYDYLNRVKKKKVLRNKKGPRKKTYSISREKKRWEWKRKQHYKKQIKHFKKLLRNNDEEEE